MKKTWMLVLSVGLFGNLPLYATPLQNLGPAHLPLHIESIVPKLAPGVLPPGLNPNQLRNAYGFNKITNQGEGQLIGIIVAAGQPNMENDLAVFSSTYGLPPCSQANGCFSKIVLGPPTTPEPTWGLEQTLDVEWAHGMAPKAKILVVETAQGDPDSLMQGVQTAIEKGANIINMSWGWFDGGGQGDTTSKFSAPGVSYVAASGDWGHQPIWPSTSPNVLSVGGTVLTTNDNGDYLGETAWEASGGGVSPSEPAPSWQVNYPVPGNTQGKRATPDVAMNSVNFSIYDSAFKPTESGWYVVGGTSGSAPIWSGLMAIIRSLRNGNTISNASIYDVAKSSDCFDAFLDITTGANGTCGFFCNAMPGYDFVTGVGTPKVQNLAAALAGFPT